MGVDEDWYTGALERAKEKFVWTGRPPQKERTPILDRQPWSDDYGPHICPSCRGVGWLVKHKADSNYPDLVACTACDKAVTATIARCWKVGSLAPDAPKPASLKTFEPHNPEADVALAAAKAFFRKPWGWLTLTGSPGTGKSHLAESIARYFLLTNVPCVFTSSVYLWEYLGGVPRGHHEDVDYGERVRWITELPALVIDELNIEKSTEFVFKTRRSLLDARYRASLDGRGVTILASNDAPSVWQDAAIADRAMDTRFVQVDTGTSSYRRIGR
jgi:DNA replication protein DnaC